MRLSLWLPLICLKAINCNDDNFKMVQIEIHDNKYQSMCWNQSTAKIGTILSRIRNIQLISQFTWCFNSVQFYIMFVALKSLNMHHFLDVYRNQMDAAITFMTLCVFLLLYFEWAAFESNFDRLFAQCTHTLVQRKFTVAFLTLLSRLWFNRSFISHFHFCSQFLWRISVVVVVERIEK